VIPPIEMTPGGQYMLPHNLEAEQSVIGSLLLDRDAIITISQNLQPEDFYAEAHRVIYDVMVDLYERRQPADYVTLADELERRDLLARCGGRGYLPRLAAAVPTAIHAQYYAEIVARLAILRRLIDAGQRITSIGFDDGNSAEEAVDRAEKLLFDVAQRRNTHGFTKIGDILTTYLDRLDYIHENRGAVAGVPSGFIELDKLTGGLQRSDLLILAGRPAMGKTACALSMCHTTAIKAKSRVAIFSLEMSAEQLVQRLLCMEGGIDQSRLRTGYINEDEWGRIIQAAAALAETDIYIDDTSNVSTMEMRSKARRLHSERPLDLVIVDYLQLMQGGVTASENRVQEISKISRELKGLARELQVPVLALSQVSRAVDSRTSHIPMLSDLRESGCLAGDTPVYLPDNGVYRPIAALVGQRDFRVLALNTDTWRHEPAVVTNAFSTGVKPVYRLTTRLGRSIRATANHKFLTINGWKRLDGLCAGTRLAAPRTLSGPMLATTTDRATSLDVIPSDVWRTIATPAMQGAGLTTRQMQAGLGNPYCGTRLYRSNLSRERTARLAGVVASEKLARLAQSDVYWDEIVSIEPDGEEEVFDLTVDGLHNFVASHIIVHNSIEQDADVVMFVYRDKVYNPETEKENIADLIVAKHRNGPTGQISLFFNETQTRFVDLAPSGMGAGGGF